jgi:hypothetical protein
VAVLGRLLVSSAERLDLPDLLSIDSYGAGDWKYFLKGIVGSDKPYILNGFDVIDPLNAIGTQSCSIRVANSITFYPGSNAGSFYAGLEEGNPNAAPLVPELRKNAINYVYLTFSTFNTSVDTRAFWDPDKDGGVGGEFTQDINTESVLEVQVNVSTGSFPANTIPVAKITVGPVVITAIEDARDLMFRLGSGGINPNPFNTYGWRSLPNSTYSRQEPPTQMQAGGVNPFQGADKNILTLKEWMDAVMSKLRELGGTSYWYDDTSSFSIIANFYDSVATTFKSKGKWIHDKTTPGLLIWTEDVQIKMTSDPRTYIVRQGSVNMANEQVMWLDLARNLTFNAADENVQWTNGQPYINTIGGAVGLFSNLSKGDYVKTANDTIDKYVRVEEFYDAVNLGGSITTAAGARSVRLGSNYLGNTGPAIGRYDKGVYLPADLQVTDRNVAAISNAGGAFHWLALRSDTIENIASATSHTLAIAIDQNDGSTARVTSTAHGLVDGDRVTITGTADYNGTYKVEVETANIFYINVTAVFGNETGTAYFATIVTAARTTPYGFQEESSNHGFSSDDTIVIAGTTGYNGKVQVNVINNTTFTIPLSAAPSVETAGTATLARIIVRNEQGSSAIIQGEVIDIGGSAVDNIRQYIGMASLSDSAPQYAVPPSYNTLDGMVNYNGVVNENLTTRISKLSAMMADKAQDKTIKYLTDASTVVNTQNGSAQELTFFPSASTLTILAPGSENSTVMLPSTSPGISLLVGYSAYVQIDRNNATTVTVQTAPTSSINIDENIFVIASRLTDNSVYLWNGLRVVGAAPLNGGGTGLTKVDHYDPLSTTLPVGNPVIVDGVNVNAGELTLFSNLGSGNNRVYKAVGTGTNITGWTAQYSFDGLLDPSNGDTVIILDGTGFADQIGTFDGTVFNFNNKVRFFNGTDYWEQSNIVTSALADNTSANVFSVNYTNSEYMIVDFSLSRGVMREAGTLHVVTDGTAVSVTTSGTTLNGATGVTFSGTIVGPLLELVYTTTSTGSPATMKYMIRRWSNSPGGPGGVPSYTGAGSSTSAGGANNNIQYNNGGLLAGNSNFNVDTVDLSLNLNGLRQVVLSSPIVIIDNTPSPTPLFTYAASYNFTVIEYSLIKSGSYRTGRLLVANDGSITSGSDDFVETIPSGVVLTCAISGSNVQVLFTSTNTGSNGTFKYSMRKWN